MQAGLTDRRLSFRDIFGQRASSRLGAIVVQLPLRDAMHVWPPTQTIVADIRVEAALLAA